MISILFSLVFCANEEDYIYLDRSAFRESHYSVQNIFPNIKPGVKLHFDKPLGGASPIYKFKFSSKEQVQNHLYNEMCIQSQAPHYNCTENFEKVKNKLKYPSFSSEFVTMASYEQFNNSSCIGRRFCERPYLSRNFQIKVFFIKFKKEKENYYVFAVPFTVSLKAKTFLYGYAKPLKYHPQEIPYLKLCSKAYYQDYVRSVNKHISSGDKLIDAQIPISFSASNIQKIFTRLYSLIGEERKKFKEIPF